ncbi:MAG: STAS domain-containing protein, partial [Bryobacteraceae bacterium]
MKTAPLLIENRDVEPNIAVVTLTGKLMLGLESAQLGTMVPELIHAGRKHFIFDLSGVSHIDSTGIGRFIDAFAKIGKGGGQLRLAGATGAVR